MRSCGLFARLVLALSLLLSFASPAFPQTLGDQLLKVLALITPVLGPLMGTTTTTVGTTTTTVATTTTTGGATTTTTGGATTTTTVQKPLDWSGSFIAWWDMEEATGAVRTNNSGTTCYTGGDLSTDCYLAETASKDIDQSSTHIVGSYSADIQEGDNEELYCTDGTCDEFNFTGSITFGCWVNPHTTSTTSTYGINHTNWSSQGFHMLRNDVAESLSCTIGDGTDLVTQASASSSLPEGSWTHIACKHDATADHVVPYINGALSGCATEASCSSQDDYTSSSSDLNIGLSSVPMGAYYDECFVASKALTAAQVCRIAACGIDGTAGPCECDGATYTDDGRLTTMSLGCSLSGVACNAAAP